MENESISENDEDAFKQVVEKLNAFFDIYYRTHFIDKDVFQNPVFFNGKATFNQTVAFNLGIALLGLVFNDANGIAKISTGSVNGAEFGISISEKIGFYGKTPIVQQGAITPPTGGATIDTQSRTAINSIITALQTLGLTA